MMKKHVSDDGLPDTTASASPAGTDWKAKLTELMAHPARSDAMHTQHASIENQIKEAARKIADSQ